MFGFFKKKNEREILMAKYAKLNEESFLLSKTNRTASDEKAAEAAEIMAQIEALPLDS
jgi:hypothetical protein